MNSAETNILTSLLGTNKQKADQIKTCDKSTISQMLALLPTNLNDRDASEVSVYGIYLAALSNHQISSSNLLLSLEKLLLSNQDSSAGLKYQDLSLFSQELFVSNPNLTDEVLFTLLNQMLDINNFIPPSRMNNFAYQFLTHLGWSDSYQAKSLVSRLKPQAFPLAYECFLIFKAYAVNLFTPEEILTLKKRPHSMHLAYKVYEVIPTNEQITNFLSSKRVKLAKPSSSYKIKDEVAFQKSTDAKLKSLKSDRLKFNLLFRNKLLSQAEFNQKNLAYTNELEQMLELIKQEQTRVKNLIKP